MTVTCTDLTGLQVEQPPAVVDEVREVGEEEESAVEQVVRDPLEGRVLSRYVARK